MNLRRTLPLYLFAVPLAALALEDVDSYVSHCNQSQGLAYCQERAQTLNGGVSNTMKGLNDFSQLMEEAAARRDNAAPPESPAEKAARLAREAKKAQEIREWQAQEAARKARSESMRGAIEGDREEYALQYVQEGLNPDLAPFTDHKKVEALRDQLYDSFNRRNYELDGQEIIRYIQYALGWKTNNAIPRSTSVDDDVWQRIHSEVKDYDDLVITPLTKISKLKRSYDALEAHFYLGKVYRYGVGKAALKTFTGEGTGYSYRHWKPVRTDPEEAAEHFARVVDALQGELRTDSTTGERFLQVSEKGYLMTIAPRQQSVVALAAYELMQAYRTGDGVKKDEGKARQLAHDLVWKLGPLHLGDLRWFQENPLVNPARATADAQAYFGTVSYQDVADLMEPELLAFAREQLKTAAGQGATP